MTIARRSKIRTIPQTCVDTTRICEWKLNELMYLRGLNQFRNISYNFFSCGIGLDSAWSPKWRQSIHWYLSASTLSIARRRCFSVDVSGCALSLVDDGLDTILDGREVGCRIITEMSLNTGNSQPTGRTGRKNDARQKLLTQDGVNIVQICRESEIKMKT
jgi:hypothetical protein